MGKMRTIKVKLGAFSDWYMSNNSDYAKDEIIDYDITEEIMIILKEINPSEVSCREIINILAENNTPIKELHEKLSEIFYHRCESYFLFEGNDHVCENEALFDSLDKDLANGIYDEYVDENKLEDDEYLESLLGDYRDWVYEHDDHQFIADRIWLNLESIREDIDLDYTIILEGPNLKTS